MCAGFNTNLFELKTYKPLRVSVYVPEMLPFPTRPAHFYKALGRLARKLTLSMGTAVISDGGKIKVLELSIDQKDFSHKIELENVGAFNVTLKPEGTYETGFADNTSEYARLVSRIVDLALVHLSDEYYKYSDLSPYIIERGEGYFDESLRKRIGVEDGRRFYRGIRLLDDIPHLIVNREIELRSWGSLLNELKILAQWWEIARGKSSSIDFYDPPKEFVRFVNWVFSNRTANVKAYPSPPIFIREITWETRAGDKALEGGLSPCDYHTQVQGIKIEDERQPLVRWKMTTKDGVVRDQFHVPELLVVGHTFKDIAMRVSKSQISQVFDILHPHCGDQQRKILDLVRKVDGILRNRFSVVYPSKLEFSLFPRDVNANTTAPRAIDIKFLDQGISIEPPYGVNFYRKYGNAAKFVKPIVGLVRILAVCEETHHSFVKTLAKEVERRNGCKVSISFANKLDAGDVDPSQHDLVLTITEQEDLIRLCKKQIIGKKGIAHQNVTPKKAVGDSIPQLAMQMTLKLGGYPWFLADPEHVDVLSIYSYRNPFSEARFYVFNVMQPEGQVVYQSKPYGSGDIALLLDALKSKVSELGRLLVMMSFDDQQIQDFVLKDVASSVSEFMLLQVLRSDELRLFSTYRPTAVAVPRRRLPTVSYPIEAYEAAPEGAILRVSNDEYYMLTTASTKVGTYYRGCPTAVKLKILGSQGTFDIGKILHYVLSLSLVSGTSGHETRLPAPLYYLKKYARYVNEYGIPDNEANFQRLFFV